MKARSAPRSSKASALVLGAHRAGSGGMGGLIIVVAIGLLLAVSIGSILGLIAFIELRRRRRDLVDLERSLPRLSARLTRLEELFREAGPALPEPTEEKAPRLKTPEEIGRALSAISARAPEAPAEAVRPAPVAPAPPAKTEAALTPLPREATPSEPVQPPLPGVEREWWSEFERRVGERWLTWVGVLALFFGVGFFVKYAIENRWLGPRARVVLGLAVGLGLLILGDRFTERKMRPLGQGLIGGGLAILYVSLFAACSVYPLISQPLAFGAMVLVTAGGVALAVRHDALALSMLAVLGGLLTPLLVSTGEDARDALFAYLVILDLGVMAVAWWRKWRALEVVAFAGTYILFAGWYRRFYSDSAMVPTLLWLGAFYAIFLCMPFAHELRRKTSLTIDRFVVAMLNATVAFVFAYWILHPEQKPVLGFVALGMSASYLVLGSLSRRRVPADGRAALGFVALAVTFLTLAVPLHLGLYGITLAWAVEGPALLYLGYKYKYYPVRVVSFFVMLLALGRLLLVHWPLHEGPFVLFWNVPFATGACLVLVTAVHALLHQWWREDAAPGDLSLKVLSACGAGFLALVLLHAELTAWHHLTRAAWPWSAALIARGAVIGLWAVGTVGYLAGGVWGRSIGSRLLGALTLGVALVLLCVWYTERLPGPYTVILNPRFLAGLMVALAAFACAALLRRRRQVLLKEEQFLAKGAVAIGAGLLTLVLVHMDLRVWLQVQVLGETAGAPELVRSVLIVAWALGAMAYLGAGMRWGSLASRIVGVVPLGVALVLAAHWYDKQLPGSYYVVLNWRFISSLIAVVGVFVYGWLLRGYPGKSSAEERGVAKAIVGVGIMSLLVLLSLEGWTYAGATAATRQTARWAGLTALSVVWGVYAAAMLAVGFWRGVRELRLAALGLFGATAVKLVLVDMAGLERIYRIISFVALGLLMIGASYLYHRIEAHLEASSAQSE